MIIEARSGIIGLVSRIIRISEEPYVDALARTERLNTTELAQESAFQFKPHLPTHVVQARSVELFSGVIKLPFPPKRTLFTGR